MSDTDTSTPWTDVNSGVVRQAIPVDQLGTATITPDGDFEAGSYATFTLTYTAGLYGIDDSGSLRICPQETELRKHDHFIARLGPGTQMEMRLHDPRRFGAVLWHSAADGDINTHPLFAKLGPEPLEESFTPSVLIEACRGRTTSIKQVVMNNHVVVGVGNIYVCEALFRSNIRPTTKAGKVSKPRLTKLTAHIKDVLAEAIQQGGTTLRDFVNEDGKPGYFKQKLNVYGREGEPCHVCKSEIKRVVISNRSTFYCPKCQK